MNNLDKRAILTYLEYEAGLSEQQARRALEWAYSEFSGYGIQDVYLTLDELIYVITGSYHYSVSRYMRGE